MLFYFAVIVFLILALARSRTRRMSPPDLYEEAYELGIRALRDQDTGVVVFDFDDCLIDTSDIRRDGQYGPLHKANWPIVKLAQFARMKGLHVMLLTARADSESNRRTILEHLQHMNLVVDDLRLKLDHEPSRFKIAVRKNMQNVLLTIGDQWPDVEGATSAWIKLPSRHDGSLHYGKI